MTKINPFLIQLVLKMPCFSPFIPYKLLYTGSTITVQHHLCTRKWLVIMLCSMCTLLFPWSNDCGPTALSQFIFFCLSVCISTPKFYPCNIWSIQDTLYMFDKHMSVTLTFWPPDDRARRFVFCSHILFNTNKRDPQKSWTHSRVHWNLDLYSLCHALWSWFSERLNMAVYFLTEIPLSRECTKALHWIWPLRNYQSSDAIQVMGYFWHRNTSLLLENDLSYKNFKRSSLSFYSI